MNRIFIENTIDGKKAEIKGDDFEHLKVLRVKTGDEIHISDNKLNLYKGVISKIENKKILLDILSSSKINENEFTGTVLFQALCKGEKNEYIIQKATELGVYKIIFFLSENCIMKINENAAKKLERYNKIAKMAAMQSGREIIPEVTGFFNFSEIAEEVKKYDEIMFFYENSDIKFSDYVKDKKYENKKTAIIIGSEGGFTEDEVLLMKSSKIAPLSLGKRILRAETAPITALSILMYLKKEI